MMCVLPKPIFVREKFKRFVFTFVVFVIRHVFRMNFGIFYAKAWGSFLSGKIDLSKFPSLKQLKVSWSTNNERKGSFLA